MRANNRITQTYITAHPEQAARVAERLPRGGAAALLAALAAEPRGALLSHMLPHDAGAVLAAMAPPDAVAALQTLPLPAAARIVKAAPALAAPFLRAADERSRQRLQRLMAYGPDTVGAAMESITGVLPHDATVGEAVRRLQNHPEDRGCEFFITDTAQRLKGTVTAADLLKAVPAAPLSLLLRAPPAALNTHMKAHAAAAHPGWLTQRRLPVVEGDGTLVGVLHYRTLAAAREGAAGLTAPAVTAMAELARLYFAALAHALNVVFSRRAS